MPANPCDIPVVGRVCGIPGQVVSSVAGSAWDAVVGSFADAVGQATRLLFTFWTRVPGPDVAQPGGPVEFIRSSTSWYAGALAVGAFLVAAARLALTRRGQQAALLAQAMVRLLAVTFLGVPVVSALLAAGDAYSDWVLTPAAGGDFGARLTGLAGVSNLAGQGLGSALVLLFALLALVSSLGQMLLVFVRAGVVTVLLGLLPLTAAVSGTDAGRQWNERSSAWLLAFVLYKPAAATVYAAAFVSIGESDSTVGIVSGVFLLALAGLTLPALLRLVVPATAAVAAGGGGGAGAAFGGALATGAVALGGGRGLTAGGGASLAPSAAGTGAGPGLQSPSGAPRTGPEPAGGAPSGGGGTSGGGAAGPASASGGSGTQEAMGPGAASGGGSVPAAAAAGSRASAAGPAIAAAAQAGQRAAGDSVRATGAGPAGDPPAGEEP